MQCVDVELILGMLILSPFRYNIRFIKTPCIVVDLLDIMKLLENIKALVIYR